MGMKKLSSAAVFTSLGGCLHPNYFFKRSTTAAAFNYRHASTLAIPSQLEQLRNPESGPAVLIPRANRIYFNLALELYLMNVVKPKVPVFLWWRNEKTVVIGKHQNPWNECALTKMEADNVELSRRPSGGGAVYQDMNNSCFTFLVPAQMFDKTVHNAILLGVLKERFGISGEQSGRNDLVTSDGKRKFSGAAFKTVKDPLSNNDPGLALHHGTILINTDLTALQRYLTPHRLKLQAKGIQSVASRVINLADLNPQINHDDLTNPLVEEFYKQYGVRCAKVTTKCQPPQDVDTTSDIAADPAFQEIYNKLSSYDWLYGYNPKFAYHAEKKFDWGLTEVHLDIQDGEIKKVKIFSDCLVEDLVPMWESALLSSHWCLIDHKDHQRVISRSGRDTWRGGGRGRGRGRGGQQQQIQQQEPPQSGGRGSF